jgi:hypothetical protein
MKIKTLFVVCLLSIANLAAAVREQVWRYELLEGSSLLNDCLICDRVSVPVPMRGSFILRLTAENPFGSSSYAIENASFQAVPDYAFTGSGTLQYGGDFALRQTMTLAGTLTTASGSSKVSFTNEISSITRRWPMIAITLVQTNGTVTSTITLEIAAAPLREIWFSTAGSFHSAIKGLPDNSVSSGDLLANAGRIVKRNSELQRFFPGPTFANMGLDAVDILPGAQLVFSTETMGVLSDGDFARLSNGAIAHWQDYIKILSPNQDTDPGLDGLQFNTSTDFYFSTKQDILSAGPTSPHLVLQHGDIANVILGPNTWSILKKNSDLLANFHPTALQDYGLDAFYIWPTGEIWFSTAQSFTDTQLGAISDGDLLSDTGYIVFRNRDLVEKFSPLEDTSNFGLDALTIISDAVAASDAPELTGPVAPADSFLLTWKGNGRVFQVERAAEVTGPWSPISEIIPSLGFEDSDGIRIREHAFYRVRQW